MATQELVTRGKDTPVTALQKLLTSNSKQLAMALPDQLRARPDRFIRLATTALITTPSLQNCNMLSICNSVMLAAQLGLEPNNGLGHGWLIPYSKVCTFQPGYRGLLDLGYRADSFRSAQAQIVYVGDDFDYEEGDTPRLVHKPAPPSQRKRTGDGPEDWDYLGAYCRVKVPDGTIDVMWMWREEIEMLRAKASKAGDNSPWFKWPWEMRKKTPVKRHMKFLRLSPEAGKAVGIDDQAEAFQNREMEGVKIPTVVQDVVLDAEFEDEALAADDALKASGWNEYNEMREQKGAQAEAELKTTRAPRKPFAVKHGEKAADTAAKIADAVVRDGMRYGKDLNKVEAQLGTSEFWRRAGVMGHDGFSLGELNEVQRAELALKMMQEG